MSLTEKMKNKMKNKIEKYLEGEIDVGELLVIRNEQIERGEVTKNALDRAVSILKDFNSRRNPREIGARGFTVDFNIKVPKLNIPDFVRRELDAQTISDIFEVEMSKRLNRFIRDVKRRFPDSVGKVAQTGRSGGQLTVELFELPDISEIQLMADHSKDILDRIDSFDDPFAEDLAEGSLLIEQADIVLEIDKMVRQGRRKLKRDLEDPNWWSQHI